MSWFLKRLGEALEVTFHFQIVFFVFVYRHLPPRSTIMLYLILTLNIVLFSVLILYCLEFAELLKETTTQFQTIYNALKKIRTIYRMKHLTED